MTGSAPAIVRSAGPDDIDALLELARLSGRGFTSLPDDRATLTDRLALSAASFAGAVAPAEAWYTLMLEDAAGVAGVAAVKGAIGLKRPHFSFRVVTLAQYSPAIDTRFDHRALVLVNECAGATEVGSLFLRPDRRSAGAGALLARARYMLIAAAPDAFAETVMAELRGSFDLDGTSAFWAGISSKFFRLPFEEADRMITSTNGQFILDLAPRYPIYLELVDATARDAVGAVHAEGVAARQMLEREGFRHGSLIDIFDGGPTVSASRDAIRTVRETRRQTVRIGAVADTAPRLIATTSLYGFRATHVPVAIDGVHAVLAPVVAAALGVDEGEQVQICR